MNLTRHQQVDDPLRTPSANLTNLQLTEVRSEHHRCASLRLPFPSPLAGEESTQHRLTTTGFGAAHADSHGFDDLLLLRLFWVFSPVTALGFGYLQGFAPPRVVHRHRLSPLLPLQVSRPRTNCLADFRDLFSAAIRCRRLSPGPDPLLAFSLLQGFYTAATVRRRDFHDLSTATLERHNRSCNELCVEMPALEALATTMPDELLGSPPLLKFLPCLLPPPNAPQKPI